MITISPFKALRPAAELAKQVASRPYDVLNSKEAKTEAEGNNVSFLHITKSEIALPETTDIHAPEVYEKAKENLDAFISRNILFRESKACYYIYELIMPARAGSDGNGKSQTGLVCAANQISHGSHTTVGDNGYILFSPDRTDVSCFTTKVFFDFLIACETKLTEPRNFIYLGFVELMIAAHEKQVKRKRMAIDHNCNASNQVF